MKDCILLDHGSGGLASQNLISDLFLKYLKDPLLNQLEDAAVLPAQQGRLAFSTDSYVVDPIIFPGGTIGELAVNGTVNDLAMRGAKPLCLSLGLILEEGFSLQRLEIIIKSIAQAADYAQVPIVTGDTKVVPSGKADKIFINTSGIGVVENGVEVATSQAEEGDVILLSGTLADHGITILTSREGLKIGGKVQSDTCPLHYLTQKNAWPGAQIGAHSARSNQGGLGTTLSEIAKSTNLCMEIDEQKIPMHGEVRSACELMGLDPLYLANEGKCLALVAPGKAQVILKAMRSVQEGIDSAMIGRVTKNIQAE